ncbi:yqaJ domain-containing protein [Trichonephila clavipes]|nr:yqaJ domain-containing protein [Trichonephila clavipes]
MAFLEKAKKQDLVLLAEELGQKVSDKMTNIELRNIIIGSKDYEEEFVRDQLSVISEERFERESEEKIARQLAIEEEKIARQHAIQQLRWESELNELRLEIESIRSNVKRTSCAEDRKKTSSNYRISIGRAEEHVRETSPAVLMAEATIPVTTPIKEEKGMDDLRVVYVKVKGEQEMVNAVIDTGAQMPVVRPDVVEGQSINNRGSIQITSAFGEHEMGEKTQMIRNPAKLREPSKKEGIISSTDSKSVCSQEVVTDLPPETQSLLNVPNGDLVAVKINGSNVQTNGQGIKESKGEVVLTCEFKKGILYSTRRGCPQSETRGQASSERWRYERSLRLSSTFFKEIACRKKSTPCSKLVMRIVYGRDLYNAAMKYGLANEEIARKQYEREYSTEVKNMWLICGQR